MPRRPSDSPVGARKRRGPGRAPPRAVEARLRYAEELCTKHQTRFSAYRRGVLRLIYLQDRPIGAYELVALLQAAQTKPVMPMTVYRTLDFLQKERLITRLPSLNAFVGCAHPDCEHVCLMLICSQCGRVAEYRDEDIDRAIEARVAEAQFLGRPRVIETAGICHHCRAAADG